MLIYASLHPEWDCLGAFSNTEQYRTISELLDTVARTHFRNTEACMEKLEALGAFLGSGGFQGILIQQDPFGQFDPTDTAWAREVVEAARASISASLWYCVSISGKLYLLLCYPRLGEESPQAAAVKAACADSARRLQASLVSRAGNLRLIVSDLQFGEAGVFRVFNDLFHAVEYYDFRTRQDTLQFLDSEQQLHGAFVSDLSVYRQLSVAVAEQLSHGEFSPRAAADLVSDALMDSCVPSMESVHYHLQVFMLTLVDYLGSTGLVDAAYMTRQRIVYRSMAFEREDQLRENLSELLGDLHQQNRTLRKIGRQKRIQAVREYVETHITSPDLTVAGISELFRISPSQLARQFRYYYGLSLYQFIGQTRLKKAQQLLVEYADWSVRQVAEAAGYTDLSTMYRAFRAQGNVTPAALRNALALDDIRSGDASP